jgi:hypothetical protein
MFLRWSGASVYTSIGWAYELLHEGWFSTLTATLVELVSASTNSLTCIVLSVPTSNWPGIYRIQLAVNELCDKNR